MNDWFHEKINRHKKMVNFQIFLNGLILVLQIWNNHNTFVKYLSAAMN